MESLWDRIEQCEKCLDGMDGSGTSDQVDSTSHSNTLKVCNNVCILVVS